MSRSAITDAHQTINAEKNINTTRPSHQLHYCSLFMTKQVKPINPTKYPGDTYYLLVMPTRCS